VTEPKERTRRSPRLLVLSRRDDRQGSRIIETAISRGADWVLVLEGDERLDETNAEDLERFLATDAIPGCAYGLRAFQMLPGGRYDPRPEWVYCLFAPQRGQHLSRDVVEWARVFKDGHHDLLRSGGISSSRVGIWRQSGRAFSRATTETALMMGYEP
jgi:hypothetical protein